MKVSTSFAAGAWYYFTLQAKDIDIDTDACDAIKTFQASVRNRIDGTSRVEFCRLKKSLNNEGNFYSASSIFLIHIAYINNMLMVSGYRV